MAHGSMFQQRLDACFWPLVRDKPERLTDQHFLLTARESVKLHYHLQKPPPSRHDLLNILKPTYRPVRIKFDLGDAIVLPGNLRYNRL